MNNSPTLSPRIEKLSRNDIATIFQKEMLPSVLFTGVCAIINLFLLSTNNEVPLSFIIIFHFFWAFTVIAALNFQHIAVMLSGKKKSYLLSNSLPEDIEESLLPAEVMRELANRQKFIASFVPGNKCLLEIKPIKDDEVNAWINNVSNTSISKPMSSFRFFFRAVGHTTLIGATIGLFFVGFMYWLLGDSSIQWARSYFIWVGAIALLSSLITLFFTANEPTQENPHETTLQVMKVTAGMVLFLGLIYFEGGFSHLG